MRGGSAMATASGVAPGMAPFDGSAGLADFDLARLGFGIDQFAKGLKCKQR